jgi:hypothetical protein
VWRVTHPANKGVCIAEILGEPDPPPPLEVQCEALKEGQHALLQQIDDRCSATLAIDCGGLEYCNPPPPFRFTCPNPPPLRK